jgi:transmembrane sensor
MDELTRKMEEARRHVQASWDEDHAALVLVGMRRRARRRAVVRAVAGIALFVLTSIGAATLVGRPTPQIATAPTPSAPIEDRTMKLGDGSTVTPLSADSKIVLKQIAPSRVDVDFEGGSSHFDVQPNPQRSFVVASGDVRIIVLGTSFTLERSEERTRVSVDRGRVRVEWPQGTRELSAGEAGWFPPEPWKELAERGDYQRAYRELAPKKPAVRDEAAELLMAADVSRLSGHDEDAVPFLSRIVERHPRDPRAPLAAFTLGRVLVDLGRHREAARGFADARRLDPQGSLAEDAFVREIEAWSRAGERDTAERRGEEYFSRFPDGRRADDVRMLLR